MAKCARSDDHYDADITLQIQPPTCFSHSPCNTCTRGRRPGTGSHLPSSFGAEHAPARACSPLTRAHCRAGEFVDASQNAIKDPDNRGKVIGGFVGGGIGLIILILLCCLCLCLCLKKRKQKKKADADAAAAPAGYRQGKKGRRSTSSRSSSDVGGVAGYHHYGRDAALGAGGGGAVGASGLAAKHHRDGKRDGYGEAADPNMVDGAPGAYGGGARAYETEVPMDGREQGVGYGGAEGARGDEHHYGRDAALGAGAAGVGGAAAKHHHDRKERKERKHRKGRRASSSSPSSSDVEGAAGGRHGGRDAALGAGGLAAKHHHGRKRDEGAYGASGRGDGIGYSDSVGYSDGVGRDVVGRDGVGRDGVEGAPGREHHYGRDAALGAGGVGAGGLAAKHHHDSRRDVDAYGREGTGVGGYEGAGVGERGFGGGGRSMSPADYHDTGYNEVVTGGAPKAIPPTGGVGGEGYGGDGGYGGSGVPGAQPTCHSGSMHVWKWCNGVLTSRDVQNAILLPVRCTSFAVKSGSCFIAGCSSTPDCSSDACCYTAV
jgi:hypothetical protein